MAKNANVSLPRGVWTLVSASGEAVTDVTVHNYGSSDIIVMATATQTAPTNGVNAGVKVRPGDAFGHDLPLANYFKGITPARVYAISLTNDGEVFVSHA